MSGITPNDLPPINELDEFTAHIPELQIDTDVLAGTDGPANFQARALANRTKYLKRILDVVSLELIGINQAVATAQQAANTAKQGADASMKKSANGADIVNPAAFRANIGLSNAMLRGEFGWGGKAVSIPNGTDIFQYFTADTPAGLYWAPFDALNTPEGFRDVTILWQPILFPLFYASLVATSFTSQSAKTATINNLAGVWGSWTVTRDNSNTIADANGFIKVASPVVQLFGAGTTELNTESDGLVTERIDRGVYRISGCLGLNADLAWGGVEGGIVGPRCRNGLERLWIDYDVDQDGSIVIRTYHRTHPNALPFARNERDGYVEGDSIDIPSDTFLSVRVQMPAREEVPCVPTVARAPTK